MREKSIVALLTVLLLLSYLIMPAMAATGKVTVRDAEGNDITDKNRIITDDDPDSEKDSQSDLNSANTSNDYVVLEEEEGEQEKPGILDGLDPFTRGKNMVGEGGIYFLELLGDAGFKVGMEEGSDVSEIRDNYGQVVMIVYTLATLEFDPYQNSFIVEMQTRFALIGAFLLVSFIILGAIDINLYAATSARNIDNAYILQKRYHLPINEYVLTLLEASAMISIGYLVLRTTLWIELLLTKLIMLQILDRIQPTGGNIVMYLMMSLCYLLIGLAIAYRIIIVGMFHASYIVFVGLYCFGITRPVAISAFWYYMKLLFLRPILVGITTVGVGVISVLNVDIDSTSTLSTYGSWTESVLVQFIIHPLLYASLIIILVIVCISMILGVKNVIGASKYALKRYAYGAMH